MAAIQNPSGFSLFSVALQRSIGPGEVVDGLTDEEADEACASGVFIRGVVVPVEEIQQPDPDPDDDETPKRRGRPKTVRGSEEVEEAVDNERETR